MFFLNVALSQPAAVPGPAPTPAPSVKPGLMRFDLDFPGGTPEDLVAAIQKAMGKPLNAIVRDEFVRMRLPALKMKNVNVAGLFQALEQASRKTEIIPTSAYGGGVQGGYTSYQQVISSYGFRNTGEGLTDETIWSFYVEKPNYPGQASGKICRFYSLVSYLERGASVDDITTAIDTGAKMLGEASGPEIRFHKDTKLLIAVGEPGKLEIVDAVLKALDPNNAISGRRPVQRFSGGGGSRGGPGESKPVDEPKSDEKTKPEEK
jgi:hypothetical protein